MIDLLKKTMLAGVGATIVTAEKIEAVLQDLVGKGKISAEEARDTARRIAEEGRREFEESRDKLNAWFDEKIRHSPVVTKKDLAAIEERLAAIEAHLRKP
jgi:polyhydroxyalkanoate synthesis regulator phasin